MRSFIVIVLVISSLGCGSQVKLKETPVSVSGKVSQSGRPIGGMVMVLQPLGDGHVKELPVHKDGTFNGELISGEYAYYIAKPAVPAAAQALKGLSPRYFEAELSRTVNVEPGQQLAIALD